MKRDRTAIALTVAGSDSSGGAGIQADIKTFSALGVYGASVITALTAQNTRGVDEVMAVPPEFVLAQMRAVACDLSVGAIKIGMLATGEIVEAVATGLDDFPDVPIVLDPVMVATSGDLLLDEDAVGLLREKLVPRATLVTPNLAEGESLERAVKLAKMYVTAAIIAADEIQIGQGRGPVHHFHAMWPAPEEGRTDA